jgi:hypothetical protein
LSRSAVSNNEELVGFERRLIQHDTVLWYTYLNNELPKHSSYRPLQPPPEPLESNPPMGRTQPEGLLLEWQTVQNQTTTHKTQWSNLRAKKILL